MEYSFKEHHLGLVYPIRDKTMTLPGSQDGMIYRHAVPDVSRKSIVYWEDYGSNVTISAPRYRKVVHRVRLVAWMNFGLITQQGYDDCIKELLRSVPRKLNSVIIQFSGQMEKTADIFARYSYREEKQYMTYPLDVVAFDFDVIYFVLNC